MCTCASQRLSLSSNALLILLARSWAHSATVHCLITRNSGLQHDALKHIPLALLRARLQLCQCTTDLNSSSPLSMAELSFVFVALRPTRPPHAFPDRLMRGACCIRAHIACRQCAVLRLRSRTRCASGLWRSATTPRLALRPEGCIRNWPRSWASSSASAGRSAWANLCSLRHSRAAGADGSGPVRVACQCVALNSRRARAGFSAARESLALQAAPGRAAERRGPYG